MVYIMKEMEIGGTWVLMDQRTLLGKDSLYEDIIDTYAAEEQDKDGSLATMVFRRFLGDTIRMEGMFGLGTLSRICKESQNKKNSMRTAFGCFPFDFIDQMDAETLRTLGYEYGIDALRIFIWVV